MYSRFSAGSASRLSKDAMAPRGGCGLPALARAGLAVPRRRLARGAQRERCGDQEPDIQPTQDGVTLPPERTHNAACVGSHRA